VVKAKVLDWEGPDPQTISMNRQDFCSPSTAARPSSGDVF
jgi:hypothetical protein